MKDIRIIEGDSLKVLKDLEEHSIDSLVTDPPAGIGLSFADGWDDPDNNQEDLKKSHISSKKKFITFLTRVFTECYRTLKPGAFGVIWSLPRTSHWTASALEDAGFIIRDTIHHINSQGFPHGVDPVKVMSKYLGYKSDLSEKWRGYHTALKGSHEVWWLVQKPYEDNLVENLIHFKVGALNIDSARTSGSWTTWRKKDGSINHDQKETNTYMWKGERKEHSDGRWPSNVVLSHHINCFRVSSATASIGSCAEEQWDCCQQCAVKQLEIQAPGASKFFPIFEPYYSNSFVYDLKPSAWERDDGANSLYWKKTDEGIELIDYAAWTQLKPEEKSSGNIHPTVKSVPLMRYFVRLCTPPGGKVLDPFLGSGTTALAGLIEERDFIGIERLHPYILIANARLEHTKVKISVLSKHRAGVELKKLRTPVGLPPILPQELFEKAAKRAIKRP